MRRGALVGGVVLALAVAAWRWRPVPPEAPPPDAEEQLLQEIGYLK